MLLLHVAACMLLARRFAVPHTVDGPAANASQFFPDWVPFKNKHGQDLGEFTQVPKGKVKKRLALPVNFILRAIVEPDGDEYFERGLGESDNEEYYEKKEWQDVQRPAQQAQGSANSSHSDISDIDEVVEIITKKPVGLIAEAINKHQKFLNKANIEPRRHKEQEKPHLIEREVVKNENVENIKQVKNKNIEEDSDYDETNSEKPKPEEKDQTENEEKKAKILNSVDELKERHAAEQRFISQKVKEEEMFKEERERDNLLRSEEQDKYLTNKKYNRIGPEYEEYDENDSSSGEKYRFSTTTTTTTGLPLRRPARRRNRNKGVRTEKSSLFKIPYNHMVTDENGANYSTTLSPTRTRPAGARTGDKFSAKYSAATAGDSRDNERISLLPENNTNADEPTLFFPKRTKSKRRKAKDITPATDSSVAESVPDTTAKYLTTDPGTVPSKAVSSSDTVPASTQHEKQHKKTEDYENEKGGGRDYHTRHEATHEEHGKKAYKGLHEDTKTAKGHHDKESHHGEYDDHNGSKEEHHDEAKHYGAHQHEEHGKKHAKYEESGKHAKGHSTKGSHDIHKKEEYEKKVEFFEEEGDSGEEEKHGGHHHEREHKEGGHHKQGNLEAGHHEHGHGISGHSQNGGHQHVHKGHKQSGGQDAHGERAHHKQHAAGHGARTGWVYHQQGPKHLAPQERAHGLLNYG